MDKVHGFDYDCACVDMFSAAVKACVALSAFSFYPSFSDATGWTLRSSFVL